MGPNASRSCAVEVLQGSLLRSPRAHRRGFGECQDIPRFKRHYATTYSILSACLASTLRIEAQPGRTAEVRDPYARWCGRGGAARRPPIPIKITFATCIREREPICRELSDRFRFRLRTRK